MRFFQFQQNFSAPFLFAIFNCFNASAQTGQPDSIQGMHYLPEITLVGAPLKRDVIQLPEIVGTQIYAGKKNALIVMDNLNTVVVNNNMRQIFAKIPGIHIWESDGSGIQVGVAARGLSPNRSWEFNIRQNGCEIAADPFGYPEAYYNPPMQAIQRIQVVRGAGSLQYGPQFGGMINYIMRDGSDIEKPVSLETQQTAGSFGLMNSFVAIGGKQKKLHYYFFYDARKADGWRENSRYYTQTVFGSVTYRLNKRMKINGEYMRYDMESQQPGGATDKEFKKDARLSSRSRNWFSTPWNTASLKYDWEISKRSRFQARLYGISGDRKSVGFMQSITVPDSINTLTGKYNPREVAIDLYRNLAFEAGYLRDYMLKGRKQTLSAGIRYFKGNTDRKQKGTGTTGINADFSIAEALFPTRISYLSNNYAAYLENVFRLGKRLLIIPGGRLEHIVVGGSGTLNTDNNGIENPMTSEKRIRTFVLGGVGVEYHLNEKYHTELYANYTQAYRPILFSNITTPTTDKVDQNLRDSRGWNSDVGIRGALAQHLYFDASVYYLKYNNRVGSVNKLENNQSYNLITNLGSTHSYGLEALLDMDPIAHFAPDISKKAGSLPIFVSYTYNVSQYEDYRITKVAGNKEIETNLKGNQVEYAPKHILRTGFGYKFKGLLATFQASHTSGVFSDAGNTLAPSTNGQNGFIPAYTVYDFMITYKIKTRYNVRLSVNNITNEMYFTRRAGGYPGPGAMAADGRSILVGIGATF